MIGRRGLLRQALSARKQRETARSEFQYAPYTLLDELQVGSREISRVVRKTPLIHGPQLVAHCNGIQPADGVATTIGDLAAGAVDSGTTTTVRRARLSPSAVMTSAGPALRISLPRAGSRFTNQISPRRTVIPAAAGAIPFSHRGFFRGSLSPSPSAMVAASHSALSAANVSSSSTANAAWYSGSSSRSCGGSASSNSRCINRLRCRTETLRLNRLTRDSGRWISNSVVATKIDARSYQYRCLGAPSSPCQRCRAPSCRCAMIGATGRGYEAARRTSSRRDPRHRRGGLPQRPASAGLRVHFEPGGAASAARGFGRRQARVP